MAVTIEKEDIDNKAIDIIDKKLLEAEELELKGGKYYTQEEMNRLFAKYENV